jgi:hypothetical protein
MIADFVVAEIWINQHYENKIYKICLNRMDTHLSWLKYLLLILKYNYLALQFTLEYLVSLWSLMQQQNVFFHYRCVSLLRSVSSKQ